MIPTLEPDRPNGRRHELDALRAFAMLLGIALHASLSFFPGGWPVQDTQQNGLMGLFYVMVHGFRMQLFFLLSGFFTMMLFRKRGLQSLLRQRAVRILIPCLVGAITIIPFMRWTFAKASQSTIQSVSARLDQNPTLIKAIRENDVEAVRSFLDQKAASSQMRQTRIGTLSDKMSTWRLAFLAILGRCQNDDHIRNECSDIQEWNRFDEIFACLNRLGGERTHDANRLLSQSQSNP